MKAWMDSLYLFAFVLVEFCTGLLTMNYIFQIPFRREKKRWAACTVMLFAAHALAAELGNYEISDGLSVVTLGIVSLTLLQERKRRVLALHLFIYLTYSSLAAMVVTFLSYAIRVPEQALFENNWLILLIDSIPLAALLLYRFLWRRAGTESEFTLQLQQIVFLLAGSVGIYLVIGFLQIQGRNIEIESFLYLNRPIITIVCFFFLLLILWQGVVVNRQNRIAEDMRLHRLFDSMKEEYFREIQTQDETMRRFRHDYRAHMTALKGYCDRGNRQELEAYLNRLLEFDSGAATRTYVGDAGVDAVINHEAERGAREGIPVDITGRGKLPAGMTSFEMCCIFSNLLSNAVEACQRMRKEASRQISLQIQDYGEALYIRLENSAPEETEAQGTTWKQDKQNHGLGLENVRRIVKKYEGRMHCERTETTYVIEIIF